MRGLTCIIGRAKAVVPGVSVDQVVRTDVSMMLPLAKPFIVGLGHLGSTPLVVCDFSAVEQGHVSCRVVLLSDDGAVPFRVGLHVGSVQALVEYDELSSHVADTGPGRFFRNGRDVEGNRIRVADTERIQDYVMGSR